MMDQSRQTLQGLRILVERISATLFAVGSWIYGGLIALDLVVMASLITVGPVDRAILTATAAFAASLPLNVAGVILLRLIADMGEINLEEVTLQAFQVAQFPHIDSHFAPSSERPAQQQRRERITLAYAFGIGMLSVALTLTGLVAAAWHMAWWVGAGLAGMMVVSAGLVMGALAHSLPPQSHAEHLVPRPRVLRIPERRGVSKE